MATDEARAIDAATANVRRLTEEIRQDRAATAEVWRGISASLRMLAAMRAGDWPPNDEDQPTIPLSSEERVALDALGRLKASGALRLVRRPADPGAAEERVREARMRGRLWAARMLDIPPFRREETDR